MTMEELIKEIKNKTETLRIIKNNLESQSAYSHDSNVMYISCNGNWGVYFTKAQVADMFAAKKLEVETELGRLQEAKRAAEITMAGWLNQSAGGKDESSKS